MLKWDDASIGWSTMITFSTWSAIHLENVLYLVSIGILLYKVWWRPFEFRKGICEIHIL